MAPGNYHLTLTIDNNEPIFKLDQRDKVWGLRPCIDFTMETAGPIFKNRCCGVILTGMGNDGSKGIEAIKQFGGKTFAQDLSEALIASMPRTCD